MTATPQASNSGHTTQRGKIAAVGMFDGVHTGHRHLLSQLVAAAKKNNLTPAVITFANHPLEIIAPARAPQLIMDSTEKQRIIATETGGPVITLDFDQRLRQTSAREFLEMLHNDHGVTTLLLGFNNRFGHDAPHDFEAYRRLGELTGIEIVKADEMPGASSSEIRRLLAAGNVADAAKLLGRPYTISGNVVEGERIG
ncbi:MAG: FAD synthetase family protein, partial [Muribaculaceae bacterium]|nr:FAD synthetase family protein [Muribaculaceae bacterium]